MKDWTKVPATLAECYTRKEFANGRECIVPVEGTPGQWVAFKVHDYLKMLPDDWLFDEIYRVALLMPETCVEIDELGESNARDMLRFVDAWPASAEWLDEVARMGDFPSFMSLVGYALVDFREWLWKFVREEAAKVGLERPKEFAQGLASSLETSSLTLEGSLRAWGLDHAILGTECKGACDPLDAPNEDIRMLKDYLLMLLPEARRQELEEWEKKAEKK